MGFLRFLFSLLLIFLSYLFLLSLCLPLPSVFYLEPHFVFLFLLLLLPSSASFSISHFLPSFLPFSIVCLSVSISVPPPPFISCFLFPIFFFSSPPFPSSLLPVYLPHNHHCVSPILIPMTIFSPVILFPIIVYPAILSLLFPNIPLLIISDSVT